MPIAAPRYTVDDLDRFPDDGQRYELLDGVLLVTPAPTLRHQVIVNRLATLLSSLLLPGQVAEVAGPGCVQVGKNLRLEPDILVFPSPANRNAGWTDISSWWLAVEVLSPSTRIYDTEWKRQAYQALGVQAVWLVDPDSDKVTTWQGADPTPNEATDHLIWSPPGLGGVRVDIDLAATFR
jgi:Uma2 family endonuclease